VLPENFALMARDAAERRAIAETMATARSRRRCRRLRVSSGCG
jgi:hypothetical protein